MVRSFIIFAMIAVIALASLFWYHSQWKASAVTPTGEGLEIPLEKRALFDYLRSGQYKSWRTKERLVRPSIGPHKYVRVYLNDILAQSLRLKNQTHPKGAVAIKEQYDKEGVSLGWSVMAKTDAQTQEGRGWFWYEVLSDKNADALVALGNGVPGCVSCHRISSNDMIRTPFPFR